MADNTLPRNGSDYRFGRWLLAIALCLLIAGCGDDSATGPSSVVWSRTGSGNTVIDKPRSVDRLRITGTFSGGAGNFIVWCGSDLVVNELMGTSFGRPTYSGTHATPNCTELRIENSTGVAWTLTEV